MQTKTLLINREQVKAILGDLSSTPALRIDQLNRLRILCDENWSIPDDVSYWCIAEIARVKNLERMKKAESECERLSAVFRTL